MLPGCEGHLVAGAFLEREIAAFADGVGTSPQRGGLLAWRTHARTLGPASTSASILQVSAAPLVAALGFGAPMQVESVDAAVAASLIARHQRTVSLLVTPWAEPLDRFWRAGVTQAIRRGASWCLLFDGLRLRLVDAARLYARRYLEFDLDLVLDSPITLAAFYRVFAAESLTADPQDASSLHALVAASERHAAGVCASLRVGVLDASEHILGALVVQRGRAIHLTPDSFEQALTIVYRMLFLLFAEARALVPLWHPVYRESYSLEALRDVSEGLRRVPGFWETLRAIARLAHAGCRAGDLRVTPFNGRLFSPSRTPLAERRNLDDEAARRALRALSSRPAADRAGRERIAYRDLGVEQLGAVYETLLDYEPKADRDGVRLETGSGVRKATGTFYTPQPIADYVVRRTLAPLVREMTPDQILGIRVVDPSMGSGAFLVAACRYLSGAYESALVRSGSGVPADIDQTDRSAIRRTIAERCLYGVDLNPMAVQLGRLSLWLATLAIDRPLSFLDHRLQVGDSLIGAWIADLRRPPEKARRQPLPLFGDDGVRDALRDAMPIRALLESMPNDTLDQVREKERAFASLGAREARIARWKLLGDVWCAAWFRDHDGPPQAAFGALSDAILKGGGALPAHAVDRYLDAVRRIANARRFFHWELEFPEVFFDRSGERRAAPGFDAVIGNPPWDMIRADSGPSERRSRSKHDVASTLRFTRDAGIYNAQSTGHANRYQLFLERAVSLTRAGGRIGLVLPSGLATDQGCGPLRRLLLSRCRVDAIAGIDNQRGIFPIHRSVRFLLLTASAGSPSDRLACRFGIRDPAALEGIGDEPAETSSWYPIHLTPALLTRISGDGLTIPALTGVIDLAIVERAASLFPPLGSDDGWQVRFGRELNASEDRGAFRERGHGMPVVEGKQVESFDVRLDRVRYSIRAADARRLLGADRVSRPRLAYRDVAGATNRTTLIAAVLPAGCVSTHTLFCLRTPLPSRAQYFLCALFNSYVLNYFVRLRVTTHVTTATVERLPMPTEAAAPATFRQIAAIGRLLSRRFDPAAFAALNARVAHLYQLSADEFRHVLDSFPLVSADDRAAAFRSFEAESRT